MFFILWGTRTRSHQLAMVQLACRNGHTAAHGLFRVVRKLTVFFIPLFPVSVRYVSVCGVCGQRVKWSKEDALRMAEGAPAVGSMVGPSAAADPVSAPVDPYGRPAGDTTGTYVPDPTAASSLPATSPPAGWYADPGGSGRQRWWDGRGWSEHLQDAPTV